MEGNMEFKSKFKKILYGGDYNPEQWSQDIWSEDMKLFKEADIDIVTLNVFNWAMLQKDEETYDFTKLDKTVKKVTESGINICMATSTGAHPAWMAKKYPDILRTEFNGMKRKYGGRHNSCPNSTTFQKYSVKLAKELAKHYKNQENIVVWHISNEYGGACYCENCEKAFRVWLKKKYKTIENLNKEWNTNFWGHTFYDWEEIVLPNLLSEHIDENRSMHQGITIDYMRFNSDSMLENFKAEYKAIKEEIPEAVITTNLMGTYKPLDYQKWGKELDIVSWDNYPEPDADPAYTAMNHNLMRGINEGRPFMLMEQTPSVTNWALNNNLKKPGVMRLLSLQAVAHGADTVMFFQMRRSPAGCEKFHGALIDHAGNNKTRVFRECSQLGLELRNIGNEIIDSRIDSKVALIFDWETWWALECSIGPSGRLRYVNEVFKYYKAFHDLNISVDIIGMKDDLSKYKIVAAPLLYMIKEDIDKRLSEFAAKGGHVIFSFLSGYVNENDYITIGGYPGKLRKMTGIWVEEIDSVSEEESNLFKYKDSFYPAELLCDVMHLEGAEMIAAYEKDFYANTPVITRNKWSGGYVHYIGCSTVNEFYKEYMKDLCLECSIESILEKDGNSIDNLEVTIRKKGDKKWIFILNHSKESQSFKLKSTGIELVTNKVIEEGNEYQIKGKDVYIIRCKNN